ncbi:MAG: hypothetical protein JWO10_1681 [Microbacteriaceae bacterium]|nr:hypothetical protein [Microbacteriaceae bacterium]
MTAAATAAAPRRRESLGLLKVFLPAFVLILLMTTLWSLASPIFSIPDENAHAVKAVAQVHGELIGHRVAGERQLVMDVPPGYLFSAETLCYVHQPNTTANCAVPVGAPGGLSAVPTQVSSYDPIYYYLVGWPSLLLNGNAGIYAMRIVSGLLTAIFLAWAVQCAIVARKTRWMPLAVAFTVSPVVLFLSGAINPNGVEIASAVALWVGLLRLLDAHRDRPLRDPAVRGGLPVPYLWVVVTLSAAILANARALGPLWVLIVVLLCLLVVGLRSIANVFRTRGSYPWIAVIIAAGLFSVLWTRLGGSLAGQAEKGDAPLVGASFLQGFAFVAKTTPGYIREAIGVFGWIDTDIPGEYIWLAVAAVAIILTLAAAGTTRRGAWLMAIMIAAALLVPALVQGYSVRQTGVIWQGRYGLFLYLGVIIVAGWLLSRSIGARLAFVAWRVTFVGAGLLWVFGSGAFLFVLVRYVIGFDAPLQRMFLAPAWQPPLGWLVLVASFTVVSFLFFGWLVALSLRTHRAERALAMQPAEA